MNKDTQQKLNELIWAIRQEAPKNAVSFRLFINSSSAQIEYDYRDGEGLKRDGISMRNLGGDFIK
jgi:hypothetical protein